MVADDPRLAFAKNLNEALEDMEIPDSARCAYLQRIANPGKAGRPITKEGVRQWLKGLGFPTIENAIRIANRLGVCVEWLLTGRGPKRPPPPGTVLLVEEIQALDPPDQGILKRVAEAFRRRG